MSNDDMTVLRDLTRTRDAASPFPERAHPIDAYLCYYDASTCNTTHAQPQDGRPSRAMRGGCYWCQAGSLAVARSPDCACGRLWSLRANGSGKELGPGDALLGDHAGDGEHRKAADVKASNREEALGQ